MDETLLDQDIVELAGKHKLIDPFRPEKGDTGACRLKGASYDVAIGETLILLSPEGPRGHSLKVDKRFRLEPGQSCVASSMEKIKIPADMKGRISLRAHLQLRGLSFPGGAIDPGFWGNLYFPVTNISDAAVDIFYDEPFATVEFVRLSKPATILYNDGHEVLSPPDTFLTPKTLLPYRLVEVRTKIDKLESGQEKLNDCFRDMEPRLGVTQRIQELFLLAAVGSIAAAAFFALAQSTQKSVLKLSLIVGGAVAVFWLLVRRWRGAST
jgi:deoxycytidine triphosphate deaminase